METYLGGDSNDIDAMLERCREIENGYWSQPYECRLAPAPFYFLRVAILSRKLNDFSGEVAICERWDRLITDYSSQLMVKEGRAANVAAGSSRQILARIPKARELKERMDRKALTGRA